MVLIREGSLKEIGGLGGGGDINGYFCYRVSSLKDF